MSRFRCTREEPGTGHWTHDRADQPGTLHVVDLGLRESRANTRENRHWGRGRAVVIAFERIETVGIRSDDSDARVCLLQWQKVILVLQQNKRLLRSLECQFPVLRRVVRGGSEPGPGNHRWRIE